MIEDNRKYLYKIGYIDKLQDTTNLLYTPLLSADDDILYMIYDETQDYQRRNTNLTKELTDFFFEREVQYLKVFQGYDWAPTLLDVDILTRTATIEFGKETLNQIITDPNRDLNEECPDWKEQIWTIIKDIDDAGYYKLTLYPHCFFLKDGKLKTIDFYACVEKSNPFLERCKLEGIIGEKSGGRFNDSTEGNLINFQTFFKITMSEFLSSSWGSDNPFLDFYKRLGNNV